MRVSVIVPVYNGARVIEGCLRALDAQTLDPGDYEVVVVDDGSTDETPDHVERFAKTARCRIKVVRVERNAGPAAARNAGLRETATEAIAFTDADCAPAFDWLQRGLERLDADGVAGVEGRTEPAGETGTLTHQMRNVTGGHWMTCNMIYRRDAIDTAGGFDERFRLPWLEDSDLAFTVQEQGGTIAWEPAALVRHAVLDEGRAKFGKEARKRFYNPLLYRKHPQLYAEHIAGVVPGLPSLHLKYMALVIAPFITWALGLPGASVLLGVGWLLYLRRLAFAYRAKDALSWVQVAVHPFVQTWWVLRGALHFKAFSARI